MSDTPGEYMANSRANLIEVHHVGVTAKMQSPLRKLLPNATSSTESDNAVAQMLHARRPQKADKTNYDAFTNDTQPDTETTTEESISRVLYEMHAISMSPVEKKSNKPTPSRIEFQRYNRPAKRTRFTLPPKRRKLRKDKRPKKSSKQPKGQKSLLQRMRQALDSMCQCKPVPSAKLLGDLPEPTWSQKGYGTNDGFIGIYPFEHGCAEYLSITDSHPRINAIIFAERATIYATHFWAEFFGLLHIGVAFVMAFLLQSYRFLLYSLVNTLLVGLLHMTSDYLFKPTLTVIFNGFVQPPFIFIYNVLASVRDILEPVADALNNFVKPMATACRSLRLVHVNYSQRKNIAKEV